MIVVWIKLFLVEGINFLFDIIGGVNLIYDNGQYYLEIDNGLVRWFYRNECNQIIFNVMLEVIVFFYVWMYVVCIYDVKLG